MSKISIEFHQVHLTSFYPHQHCWPLFGTHQVIRQGRSGTRTFFFDYEVLLTSVNVGVWSGCYMIPQSSNCLDSIGNAAHHTACSAGLGPPPIQDLLHRRSSPHGRRRFIRRQRRSSPLPLTPRFPIRRCPRRPVVPRPLDLRLRGRRSPFRLPRRPRAPPA